MSEPSRSLQNENLYFTPPSFSRTQNKGMEEYAADKTLKVSLETVTTLSQEARLLNERLSSLSKEQDLEKEAKNRKEVHFENEESEEPSSSEKSDRRKWKSVNYGSSPLSSPETLKEEEISSIKGTRTKSLGGDETPPSFLTAEYRTTSLQSQRYKARLQKHEEKELETSIKAKDTAHESRNQGRPKSIVGLPFSTSKSFFLFGKKESETSRFIKSLESLDKITAAPSKKEWHVQMLGKIEQKIKSKLDKCFSDKGGSLPKPGVLVEELVIDGLSFVHFSKNLIEMKKFAEEMHFSHDFFAEVQQFSAPEDLFSYFQNTKDPERKSLVLTLIGGKHGLAILEELNDRSKKAEWEAFAKEEIERRTTGNLVKILPVTWKTPPVSVEEAEKRLLALLSKKVKECQRSAEISSSTPDFIEQIKGMIRENVLGVLEIHHRYKEIQILHPFLSGLDEIWKTATPTEFLHLFDELPPAKQEIVLCFLGGRQAIVWMRTLLKKETIKFMHEALFEIERTLSLIEKKVEYFDKGFDLESTPYCTIPFRELVASMRAFENNAYKDCSDFFALNDVPLKIPDLTEWAKTYLPDSFKEIASNGGPVFVTWLLYEIETQLLECKSKPQEIYHRVFLLTRGEGVEEKNMLLSFLKDCIKIYDFYYVKESKLSNEQTIEALRLAIQNELDQTAIPITPDLSKMLKKELGDKTSSLFKVLSPDLGLSTDERASQLAIQLHGAYQNREKNALKSLLTNCLNKCSLDAKKNSKLKEDQVFEDLKSMILHEMESGKYELSEELRTLLRRELKSSKSPFLKKLHPSYELSTSERIADVTSRLLNYLDFEKNKAAFPSLLIFQALSFSAFLAADLKLRQVFTKLYVSEPEGIGLKNPPSPPASYKIYFDRNTAVFNVARQKNMTLSTTTKNENSKAEEIHGELPLYFTINGVLTQEREFSALLKTGTFSFKREVSLNRRLEITREIKKLLK